MGTHFSYQPTSRQTTNARVLADVRRIARTLVPRGSYLSYRLYRRRGGRFSATLLIHRFGSWNNTLQSAGLRVGHRYRIPDEAFFAQLESRWRDLGRQPTRSEIDATESSISAPAYVRRFGTWGAALRAFVAWKNAAGKIDDSSQLPITSARASTANQANPTNALHRSSLSHP